MSELVSGNSQAAGKVSSTEDGFRKLIIQIPCYNEAGTLAIALADLPRQVTGYDVVEWLVIDDGCTDDTVKVALENGVDHIVSLRRNQGLAKGFMAGCGGKCTLLTIDCTTAMDISELCVVDHFYRCQ